jgi:archaemetzincin
MKTPQPGEWRYHFHERPQSFEEFDRDAPRFAAPERCTAYLQPMTPTLDPVLSRRLQDYADLFLAPARVRRLEPVPLYAPAWSPQRRQYDAERLIRALAASAPPEPLLVLGILDDADLYSGSLNFVFGSADMMTRCGVISLFRLGSTDSARALRRALGLMTHEAGHLLGLRHCVERPCLMNGSNSLEEADRRPIWLCPDDERKLQSRLGFDPRARFEALSAYLKSHSCGD